MSRWYELFWSGEKLKSPLALDTETEAIDPNKKDSFPRFVLGTASDGERTCVIGPHQVVDFLLLHKDCEIVGQNWAFDHWVLERFLSEGLASDDASVSPFASAVKVLWDAASENRIHDTLLLDQLIRLAEGRGEGGGDGDGKFFRRDLGAIVKDHLHEEMSKKGNEYRLRFAELWDVPLERWAADVDPGFFEYACKDALKTLQLYQVMRPYAESLQKRFGGVAYPDAQKRFGVLTEAIQVKASIALAKVTKNGMRIDREKAKVLEDAARKEFDEFIPFLAEHFPSVLQPYKRKEGYKISKKTGVPKMNFKELQDLFTKWSPSFGLEGPILSRGKERRVSVSTKDWGIFKDKSEFIKRWVNAKAISMRLGFFDMIRQDRLHPTYNTMVRTGRTSSQRPNAQQMPKKGDFRSCFIASDGNFLLTSDYGAIELCTLAAVCQKRFGFSVLGDTIRSGKDPHLYTAALILKKDYEDLKVELKKEKELEKPGGPVSDARQAAKACFHPDVELLTPVGWKKISDVTTDDLVAQYWPGEGEVEFVHPTHKVVLQDKPLLEVETRHSYLRVTPDHRMYGLDWAEKPMVCFPCDYKRRTRKTVHAGIKAEGGVQDEWNIRRAVCIQADGSRLESGLGFTFGFKKEKKIERFKNLFDQHIVWEKKDPSGITRFRVNNLPEWGKYLTDEKTFRTDKLLDLDETSRKAFLDELYFWDGTHKTSDRAFSVTTIRKEVADSIQAVASVTGRRTVVNTWIPNLSDKPAYEISIVTCSDARPSEMNVSETDYVGEVHCVSVPSTLLITRDSLRVQVSGNCNFGIPGGLGKDKLVEYAKATYGVTMSVKQAEEFRSKIINEVYPELDLYLQSSDLKNLADNLSLPEEALYEYVFENYGDVGMFLHCMGRVIGHDEKKNGPLLKKDGTEFSPSFKEKLWHLAEELLEMSFLPAAEKKDLRPNIKDRKGEWKLWKAFFGGIAVTLTGRVRRGVKFTEQMNTQFQGLAADGMKLAIFEMVKRGKRLVATVHDEAVNDVRKEIAEKEREEIGEIMKQCMGEVLDFAVPISVEHKLAECWSK